MDFAHYVESYQALYLNAKHVSEPKLSRLSEIISFVPKKILIVAPHPDDECLMAGLAIRAQEEFGAKVVVVPFTYGSNPARRKVRKVELSDALTLLNFQLADPRKDQAALDLNELNIDELGDVISHEDPDVVISCHRNDGHPTHVRSSHATEQALWQLVRDHHKTVHWLQTEFWQSMPHPNVLIPLSAKHLILMGEALMKHAGEVSRNPYHLTLPAWAMDQLRRGSEMLESGSGHNNVDQKNVGQKSVGQKSADAIFAQVYRLDVMKP